MSKESQFCDKHRKLSKLFKFKELIRLQIMKERTFNYYLTKNGTSTLLRKLLYIKHLVT